ncbi:hypothetical protein SE17_33240 [Kouleothrix aurantiaca]|uniref:Uncharacterized protein n=1 Tax=Kouleothrix aurantiaca TaxID=186479 RepID=A0A0P9DHE2_9CHLR|nr:hypothetical protein SE17_33240 [Kouleothrix aurantiaca]
MLKHRLTDRELDQTSAGDHFPSQRQRTIAVRKRYTEHLERLTMDEASIQHDRNLTASPSGEDMLNDWLIEGTAGDVFVGEPPSYLHDASSRLCRARNMIGNLAQMHGLGLN